MKPLKFQPVYGIAATYGPQTARSKYPHTHTIMHVPIMHQKSHPHKLHRPKHSKIQCVGVRREALRLHRIDAMARDSGGYGGGGGGSAARSGCAPAEPPARRPSGGCSGRQGPRRGSEPLLGRRRCSLRIESIGKRRARGGARHEARRALPEARLQDLELKPSNAP